MDIHGATLNITFRDHERGIYVSVAGVIDQEMHHYSMGPFSSLESFQAVDDVINSWLARRDQAKLF